MTLPEPDFEPTRANDGVATRPRSARFSRQHPWPVEFDPPGQDLVVGVVVPFDFGLDWEYWRYLPPQVVLHFTRTPYLRLPVGISLARAVGRPSVVARAARTLLAVDPQAVLYACSSGSFVDGLAGDERLRASMAGSGVRRPVTTSSGMLDAFRTIGVRRVAVATPYTASLTARLGTFLEEAGIEVVSSRHLGLTRDIAQVSQATIASLVRSLDEHDADAVFVSCTGLRTYGIVTGLEGDLQRPVFTSNQVSLWRALVAAGALPRPRQAPGRRWTMGGPPPVARSTMMLMEASAAVAEADRTFGTEASGGAAALTP